jgi:osmotically-inducible protein OsmY
MGDCTPNPGETMFTTNLCRNVLDELSWEPALGATQIEVSDEDGTVTLTGSVTSYREKRLAEQVVRRVQGVKSVANELMVRLPPTRVRSDTELDEAVRQVLTWNTLIPVDRLEISVADGMVTIAGEVDWYHQKKAIEAAVNPLVGVSGIDNQVRLRPQPLAEEVETKIRQAFHRNADIDADQVHVSVDGGKIILRGVVRSLSEVEAAESAAWAAPGVTEVESHLRSDDELARV